MNRWIALMAALMLLLTACGTEPEDKAYDLVYDLTNYEFFSEIFEEKSMEEWDSMGRYTMLLNGLHTPVVVNMDGTDVLSIAAYDQTVELGEAGAANEYHGGLSPVDYIGSTPDAVVIRISGGETNDDSILITKDRIYAFQQETDCDTSFFVREDGTLEYCRIWKDPSDLEEMGYYALEHCTDRNEILSETGSAKFEDGNLVLTAEETVVFSDVFDLDALFAEAQAEGVFEEYDSVDALLAANEG